MYPVIDNRLVSVGYVLFHLRRISDDDNNVVHSTYVHAMSMQKCYARDGDNARSVLGAARAYVYPPQSYVRYSCRVLGLSRNHYSGLI